MSNTDTTTDAGQPPVINPGEPYRMPEQSAVDDWRRGTPMQTPLQQQSPLAPMGMPPAPTQPPKYPQVNFPPIHQAPQEQKLPQAPDAKDYQKGAMEFASAMAVLGAVAGRFTRAPGGAALSAFAGALKGWQEGNLQAYENAAKQWEQNTKATIENNQQLMEKYKIALQNRQMNIDQQMSEIQLISAQYHDQMMYDAAAAKNYQLVGQIYEKNQIYTEKAKEAAAKLQEKRDEQKTKNEQSATYWLSPEGQARLPTLSPAQQAGVKQLIDIYGQKNAKPQNAALQRFLEENPNATAQEIQHFQQAGRPPRSASAMSMQKFMEEHPEATSDDIQQFQAKQAELSSGARTKGTRETNLDIILRVTDSAIPAALEASDKVPRGKYVPINQIIQGGQIRASDPDLMKFGMANLQLAEGWARAMNPTGVMRESDRDKALSFLSTATSKETYKALVEQLRTQIQRERAAIQSGKQQAVAAPGEMPSVSESTGAGWTDLGNGVRIREKP